MEARRVSSTKYCIAIRPAVNRELIATPASTIVSGVAPRILAIKRMITVVRMEKTNADNVVRYGLFITTASAMLLPVVPAPKRRMPTAAPNAAALERPSVKGDASGLRRTDCIVTPAIAKPAPATIAVNAWGMRMFQMILS